MTENANALVQKFQTELTQAQSAVSNLETQLSNEKQRIEQLRGAIYALNTLIQTQKRADAADQSATVKKPELVKTVAAASNGTGTTPAQTEEAPAT